MKKNRIASINSVILLILGFFPLISGGGKSFSVISIFRYAIGGYFTDGWITNTIIVWDIVTVLTYLIYPIRIRSLARGEENIALRSAAMYIGFIGTIATTSIMAFLLMIGGATVKAPTAFVFVIMAVSCLTWILERVLPEDGEKREKKAKPKTAESEVPVWARVVFVLLSAVFVANAFLVKWLAFGGHSYTVFQFFRLIVHYGGLSDTLGHLYGISTAAMIKSAEFAVLAPSCYALYLIPVAVCIAAVRIVLIACGKKHFTLGTAVTVAAVMQPIVISMFGGYDYKAGIFVAVAVSGLDFLMTVYYRQRKDMNERAEEAKLLEAARAEERRRRRYFPGKYGKDFYDVVLKNFKYNLRSYVLFVVGAGGVAAILCVLFGICVGLGGRGFLLDTQDEMNFGASVLTTTKQILPVFAFFSILILALIITHYIRTRMVNYSVFSALGIRPDTLRRVISIEYLGCLLFSLISGAVIGEILIFLIRKKLTAAATGLVWDLGAGATLGYTAGAFVLVALVATLINYHLFEYSDILNLAPKDDDEPYVGKFVFIRIATGLAVFIYSFFQFAHVDNSESFEWIAGMLVGSFIVMRATAVGVVKNAERSGSDRRLLDILPWRHSFKTNTRFWFLLFAFQFLIFTVYIPAFSSNRAAEDVESLYPYDFVCMAHQGDGKYFDDIEQKYDADIDSYQMLRVTTPLGRPYSWKQALSSAYVSVLWPQGQHVSVSESTYRRLEAAAGLDPTGLDLKGKQIHIVFQQDVSVKAHPLDYYMSGVNRFRIGQPLDSYNYMARERLYPSHEVEGSERSILTGMFGQGNEEDIVVMSDEYFDSLYAKEAGGNAPSRLELIRCDKDDYSAIDGELKAFAKANSSDTQWDASIRPYYGKKQMMSATTSSRTLTGATNMMVMIGLTLSLIFVFYIKYGLDERELIEKFDLLKRLGMPERKQRGLLAKEMRFYTLGTWAVALAAAIPPVIMTTAMRMYTQSETSVFMKTCGAVFVTYTAVYAAGTLLIGHGYAKRVIGTEIRREGE